MTFANADALGVAWLAIWNRDLARTKRQRQHDSDEENDDGDNNNNIDDDADDAAGVLFAWSRDIDPSKAIDDPVMSRRIGLAQGLLDFSGCVCGPDCLGDRG